MDKLADGKKEKEGEDGGEMNNEGASQK